MSNICYKYDNQETPNYYYYIAEECFIISDRILCINYCEEYDIIKKIQKNEDDFFDFSKNFIDVGSDDGNYAMLLDFKHNYCFEPNKRAACILHANMYLKNKVYNTDVYNDILSDNNEDVSFDGFTCNNDSLRESYENHAVFEGVHTVKAKTLDSYDFKNVGFIKIDVEGFEEKVIRGGLLTIIKNDYPPILFECWDVGNYNMTAEKHDSLFNLLKVLDYEILEHWGDHETHLAIHKSKLKNNQ
ncbi:FkbM family methyltransferase [uncultured Methanobrevibacter sp.]|uniref:FkbM family methyltransferase n=1 Tax=uncultured Methanobrevibacter sp. TaxID=253161 RepID=UPI0025EB29BE|nr:FkbM family methyltransferase [uncultured Methanobrevibacter sp.]